MKVERWDNVTAATRLKFQADGAGATLDVVAPATGDRGVGTSMWRHRGCHHVHRHRWP